MSQARKSSVDNVRRTKAHIPYRADDLTHGKKTGVNVRVIDRKSDGFESFGEVLTQADVVTPPHLRKRKRGNRTPSPVAEFDENGEVSMDLDDPSMDMDTPRMYFNNAPRPSAPSSANRSAVSSRPGNRSSMIDYDNIPSPRASTFSHRSRVNGATTPIGRSKSHLSQVVPSSAEEDDEDDRNEGSFGDMLDDKNDDFDPPLPDQHSPEHNRSFTEIDREEDEPEPELEPHSRATISSPPRPRRAEKSKRKEPTPEVDQVEDEIDRGLDEIGPHESEGFEVAEEPPKKKRGKQPADASKPVKKKKVSTELSGADSTKYMDGVRRGTRTRYKPLDWWRCEKVVYGRRDSGVSMVPVIKDIIRVPKEPTQPLSNRNKAGQKRARSRSKAIDDEENQEVMVYNPEEGWDDNMDPHGVVLDYVTHEEVRRRIAFTAKMVSPKPAANNEFAFQKIFGDGEFIAAGQLLIPVGGKKPSKGTKDNTYVFFVIEGAVSLKIHRTSFIVATGGMFLIPRGNNYYIENVSQRSAKLFFTQARKVNAEDEAPPEVRPANALRKSVDPSRRLSGSTANGGKTPIAGRSSSVAVTSSPDKVNEGKATTKRAISK